MIDYILHTTGYEKIYYVGHSEGTTQFWVMASEKSEYNSKITLMIGLAPAAFIGNIRGPVRKLAKLTYFGVVRELLLRHWMDFEVDFISPFISLTVGRRNFWLSGISFTVRLGKIRIEPILPESGVHAIHLQQYPVSSRGIQSCGIKYSKIKRIYRFPFPILLFLLAY